MGFLLAGGKSSRMGADKAFLNFCGQTLLDHALAVMREVCGRVVVVGDPVRFAEYGSAVNDIFTGCGPLGGIHAALASSSAELNLILAVDMPFVTAELLGFLLGVAENADSTVTVPRTNRGLQPLCAVYRRDFRSVAEQALQVGNYKIDAAFSGVAVRVIDEEELHAAGFFAESFLNVNTPQDYREAGGGPLS
jgi:molybdopterin-guanine dinucleotide biosynthesis protein A